MAVSQAKLEANRRNAQKSTGPRTEEGKKISRGNALDHGCRATKLILPEEDPEVLDGRHKAWIARFGPRDETEAYFLEDAVVSTWQVDRARRAQAARLTAAILDDGAEKQQAIDLAVADLGRRLFADRQGPLMLYPSPTLVERMDVSRDPSTSYAGPNKDNGTDHPTDLVLCLQSTLTGCEWLLNQWAQLETILDKGQPWLASDKLKAVRLLGKQPFDLLDDRDVAVVFLASSLLKPDKKAWYWEIAMELAQKDIRRFQSKAADRELESLMPPDAAAAREALREIVGRARQRLNLKAEAHRERARLQAALAADRLAFDESTVGERLRRYELSSGRAVARSLDKMLQLQKDDCPSSDVAGDVQIGTEPFAPNEPTASAISDHEPAGGLLSVVTCPLPVTTCEMEPGNVPDGPPAQDPAVDIEKATAWISEELAKRQQERARRLATINEQARHERAGARATRRSRVTAPKTSRDRAERSNKGRDVGAGQGRNKATAAREQRELDELLNMLRGTTSMASLARK